MITESPSRLEIAFERRRLAIKHAFFRWRMKITGNLRPASHPFISGDGFRALAQFRFDSIGDIEAVGGGPKGSASQSDRNDAEAFDAEKDHGIFNPKRGDVIFVANPLIKDFFEKVHPKIKDPYILITHNGDTNIDGSFLGFIDDKIISWFAQNVLVEHPKLAPIPIGLENLHYHQNGIVSLFKKMHRRLKKRESTVTGSGRKVRIFYQFKVRTNAVERQPALDYFSRNPMSDTVEDKLSPWLYQNKLSSYMFVASPPGNGEDCIRTWEAMYLGVVPIVKRSIGMDHFKRLGLPMLVVDEWTDLDAFDEEKLAAAYDTITDGSRTEALYMDYWTAQIKAADSTSKCYNRLS